MRASESRFRGCRRTPAPPGRRGSAERRSGRAQERAGHWESRAVPTVLPGVPERTRPRPGGDGPGELGPPRGTHVDQNGGVENNQGRLVRRTGRGLGQLLGEVSADQMRRIAAGHADSGGQPLGAVAFTGPRQARQPASVVGVGDVQRVGPHGCRQRGWLGIARMKRSAWAPYTTAISLHLRTRSSGRRAIRCRCHLPPRRRTRQGGSPQRLGR